MEWEDGDVQFIWGPNVHEQSMTEGEEQENLIDLLADVTTKDELGALMSSVEAFCEAHPKNGIVAQALLDATTRLG